MNKFSFILISALVAVSANAQLSGGEPAPPPVLQPPDQLEPPKAEPLPIVIGEAGYGGTGCTAGNALIGHDDQGRITVLLAPMIVSGRGSSAAFARSACSVRVPITVPQNHKLVVVEVANRGLYGVDDEDSLTLTQETGFVGMNKQPQVLELQPSGDGDLNWDSSVGQLPESSCEKTENILSLNTNALLKKHKAQPTSSLLVLDSVEVQLILEPCQEPPTRVDKE